MSRKIDTSDGYGDLSDEDLQYLAQRDDQEAAAELNDRGGSIDVSKPRPIEEVANTGDANTSGESIEELEQRLARMKEEQGAGEADDDEGLEPPYDQYRNDDLRSEIVRRNEGRDEADQLSLDGRKEDLVATLEADDEDEED